MPAAHACQPRRMMLYTSRQPRRHNRDGYLRPEIRPSKHLHENQLFFFELSGFLPLWSLSKIKLSMAADNPEFGGRLVFCSSSAVAAGAAGSGGAAGAGTAAASSGGGGVGSASGAPSSLAGTDELSRAS
mmetsp:Transcript_24229/g.75394  ORF Transcript_24229/g.75394 Transcript_24229/m.75394 type:complete len:130 (+) Transcript_24229:68-457(+)